MTMNMIKNQHGKRDGITNKRRGYPNHTLREVPSVNSITRLRQQQAAERHLLSSNNTSLLSQLARKHAPGVRRPGCPCCDPDDPSNIVDSLMTL